MKKTITTLLTLVITLSIMLPLNVRAATTYVLNTRSKVFHNPSCASVKKMSSNNRWDVDKSYDEVVSMGYSPCHNCRPGRVYTSVSSPVTPVTNDTTATQTTTRSTPVQVASVTPQQAVEQAFALYIQSGIDQTTALQRVQAKTAEFVSQPGNISAIVVADINAMKTAVPVVTAPTALTPQQIVEQAFALYIQGGLDQNTALQRVQAKTAELVAASPDIAPVVQADLAAMKGAAPAAASLTPEQIVQQAFAQYIATGMTQEQALAAVQANLPALLAGAQ